jgi:hypothetical protein
VGNKRFGTAELIALIGLVGGIVVWAVRVEGRGHTQDVQIEDVRQTHSTDTAQIREDLAYIRERIDRAIEAGR